LISIFFLLTANLKQLLTSVPDYSKNKSAHIITPSILVEALDVKNKRISL